MLLAINGRDGPYRIQVFDASGAKVPDEYGDGNFASSGAVGMAQIKPGSVYVDRLYLPKFIKFKQPGEYKVVASRWLGFGQSPGMNRLMRNGSLLSGDGLNWVEKSGEYLASATQEALISSVANLLPEKILNLLHHFHKPVHLGLGVVKIEAGAGGGFHAELVHERLGAMMTAA